MKQILLIPELFELISDKLSLTSSQRLTTCNKLTYSMRDFIRFNDYYICSKPQDYSVYFFGSIRKINIKVNFNESNNNLRLYRNIVPYMFPPNLTHLKINFPSLLINFKDCIPSTLKKLTIEQQEPNQIKYSIDSIMELIMEDSITHLILIGDFYLEKDISIPKSLISLALSGNSSYYNCDFSESNLKRLNLGNGFNSLITFPSESKLTHLSFGNIFNKYFDLSSLSNLLHLTFGDKFNDWIDISCLVLLTNLTFGRDFNSEIYFPPKPKISSLTFGEKYNRPIDLSGLPLINLTFGNNFNQQINISTQELTKLTLGKNFNQSLDGIFFPKLTSLSFGLESFYNRLLEKSSFPKLLTLSYGIWFDLPIKNNMPPDLKYLYLGNFLVSSIFYK